MWLQPQEKQQLYIQLLPSLQLPHRAALAPHLLHLPLHLCLLQQQLLLLR
jgi:hypothetical protein